MEYRKIFWGVILVLLGVALILKNFGVIWFSWHSIWHLWPLLLILWGIAVLPVKDVWKLLISLAAVVLTIIFFYHGSSRYNDDWNFSFDWKDRPSWSGKEQAFSEPYDSTVRFAMINLDAAAGKFTVSGTTKELVSFSNKGDVGTYSMEVQRTGDTAMIDLDMHSLKGKETKDGHGHRVDLMLNPEPVWGFDLDVGAAEVDMDLSGYKIGRIDLDGGACSVDIKLGSFHPESRIDIETGASSITIRIPVEAGCEVVTNTVLSSRELEGFEKVADRTRQTANFSSAGQKIYISLDAAVSSLTVLRY